MGLDKQLTPVAANLFLWVVLSYCGQIMNEVRQRHQLVFWLEKLSHVKKIDPALNADVSSARAIEAVLSVRSVGAPQAKCLKGGAKCSRYLLLRIAP